jgi:uncharacterized protein (DUF1810 family)
MDHLEFGHFLEAQNAVYDDVVQELAAGRKQTHWMWFIFPQLQGLGRSEMAQRFALRSLDEAVRYAADPQLGARLRQCTGLVNQTKGGSISEIFGDPDDLKFHSSMTLFALAVPGDPIFKSALDKFFGGQMDHKTVALLETIGNPPSAVLLRTGRQS